ncbi:MAG: ABC transporter substrate-binding protein [Campylobacter sputorum]|uniref:siderophore ABC transporter substrate-binding protein n=1 Tax=Campylobacter sputorum TaxID=206 RepID=UPI000B77B7F0|nr:ABC transporter substrate-binding protein [Campylobacter sputorum]ASM38783.1 ferric enterobactin ABC transporter CeuBCDE, periplasmic substrate-binding protein [Campylobacter sputorum bv. paraureolyticus LMG 11764]MDY6120565.1 ABC transporter substrate-binding protein [Campylobacter sputorum]
MLKISKKVAIISLIALFAYSLNAKEIEIVSLNAASQKTTIKVPQNPKRVAVADMASLDTIDALGFGSNVVGLTKAQKVYYLSKYNDDKNIKNIGSVKEVDLEALMSSEPDIIFIGTRLASQYDKLSKIAPVVYLGIDYKNGTFNSVRENVNTISKIFGVENFANDKFNKFEKRLKDIKEKASGKTAILGLVSSSSFNTLGNEKRCAMITTDAGFENVVLDAKTTHGNDSSFELVLKLNPDYIFVLDRDSAISKKGAKLAKSVMDNELINKTKAHKNGNIFYLNPSVWYLSEGGITAMDLMIKDLEEALRYP